LELRSRRKGCRGRAHLHPAESLLRLCATPRTAAAFLIHVTSEASSLKGKHVQALLDCWQTEGLSSGTIKNRLSHLRWWAEKIGKVGILLADNAQLGQAI